MSTRRSKGIWLLLVEPLDLECVIHKSKRADDTLQAAIGSVDIQASIDTIHPASIDTIHLTSIDTIQPVSENTVHPGTVHRDTVHPGSVRRGSVHPVSVDTVHPPSIDTVHPPSLFIPTLDEEGRTRNSTGQLEEEKKDQGRSSGIIDPSLLKWCLEIQSAQSPKVKLNDYNKTLIGRQPTMCRGTVPSIDTVAETSIGTVAEAFLDVNYNIAEMMILSFKSCESLLFSNLFQRDCPFVLLEDKQKHPDTCLKSLHHVIDTPKDFLDVDCNIAEVMILSFKSCESLLFSNLFQRDCPSVLLEDKQKGTFWINMVILEPFEMHNCTGASDVYLSDVMSVLLKSGQSASRKEAVEEMKDCLLHKDSNKKNSNGTWWRQSSRFDSHEFLDIGQKEVNMTCWQPPLKLDSWKPVQSRRVKCLAMDGDLPTVRLSPSFDNRYSFELDFKCHQFEVDQHPIAEVMSIVLKSGKSASREEAVEEMKDCRPMVNH
ncbi:hypothetical protein DY000_02016086 [Brassica cretica]|uniref:Uncharacterized protein n=1 Tax=Brassica cretica TaxID=69181 RepID=A0ABQ7CTI4_BRACR|nr:hypothetical protein DY000_02016086 [Brassica cretica]